MKKLIILLLCFVYIGLVMSLGCKKQDAVKAEIILKLGHSLDITHPVHKAMVYMAEKVAERCVSGRAA